MSLAIGVGVLADLIQHDAEGAAWMRQQVTIVNQVLARNGLPTFTEPGHIDLSHTFSTNFSYSFLHYLRRVYAYIEEKIELTPLNGRMSDADDSLIYDVSTLFNSHLLCHSDAEGFYVPVDFADPIFDDTVPGTMLGSSHALLRELQRIASAINIDVQDGPLASVTLQQLLDDEAANKPYYRERLVWYALYEAAVLSVRHSTMVVFQ